MANVQCLTGDVTKAQFCPPVIKHPSCFCLFNLILLFQKVILSGKDGSVIWRAGLRNFEMSSDLTIQTTEPHRDIYLYKMKGRGAHVYQDVTGEIHGVGVQRNVSNTHTNYIFYILTYKLDALNLSLQTSSIVNKHKQMGFFPFRFPYFQIMTVGQTTYS